MTTSNITTASQSSVSISATELESLKYNDLARFASQIGVKMIGLKKDQLLAKCIEAITPQKQTLNIAEVKNKADLMEAGLTEMEISTLIDGGDIDNYDSVLDSVILRSELAEEVLYKIFGKVYDNEAKLAKRSQNKSSQMIALFEAGVRPCDISRELDAHPSFVFGVLDRYKKKMGLK